MFKYYKVIIALSFTPTRRSNNNALVMDFYGGHFNLNYYKEEKAELIKNGTLGKYREMIKEAYNDGFEPSEDPRDYFIFETELDKILCDRINKSTKTKKRSCRNHANFMRLKYDNLGFLELGYSNITRDRSTLDSKREIVCKILDECFEDYYGMPEISPNGKLHFHFIVAWNGEIKQDDLFVSKRNGHDVVLVKYPKLQSLWFGEAKIGKNGTKQPSKYGIYDLVYISRTKEDSNRISNYVMKNLNTMDSYILKNEQIDTDVMIDEELVFQVNNSNIMVKRNTPFQRWNKAFIEQKKFIKHQCRVFDTPFYEANKYASFEVFKNWASLHIGSRATDYCEIIPKDFKLIAIEDF